jgi:uncharacterized protein YjeT (DUF2065 family)
MAIVRFVLPFLFVRNWHSGVWEFSKARLILFSIGVGLLVAGVVIAYILQTPTVYNAS